MGGFFSSSAQAPSLSAMPVNLEAGRNNRRNNAYNAKAPRLNNRGVNVEAPPAGPNGATAPAVNAGTNLERGANNGAAAPRRPNTTNRNKNLEKGNNRNKTRAANNVVITIQPNNASTIASDPGRRTNSPSMAGGKRRKSRRGRKSRRHTKKH